MGLRDRHGDGNRRVTRTGLTRDQGTTQDRRGGGGNLPLSCVGRARDGGQRVSDAMKFDLVGVRRFRRWQWALDPVGV